MLGNLQGPAYLLLAIKFTAVDDRFRRPEKLGLLGCVCNDLDRGSRSDDADQAPRWKYVSL